MDIFEKFLAFLFITIILFPIFYIRYWQADGVLECFFDSSPRLCSIQMKGK